MPPKPVQVSVAREGDVLLVQVSGPVDSEQIDVFKQQLDPIFAAKGALVLMDCKNLTYLNSRAIGLIMKYYRQLAFSMGRLVLFGVNKRLVRTLDLLHVGKELPIAESREEALKILNP